MNTLMSIALAYVPVLSEWWFGHPRDLIRLASDIHPWKQVPRQFGNVVLDADIRGKVCINFKGSHTSVVSNPPIKDGGRIILCADLEEVGSEEGFVQALSRLHHGRVLKL